MKPFRKIALATALTTAMSVGAVVSLGGGTLFQTGSDGGWFSTLLGSPAVVRTASPRADTRLTDQSDDTASARTILNPRQGEEDLASALARMASVPYVTLEDALAGAVAGDAAGMARLQAFLDRAGFDPEALEGRAFALFDALMAGRDLAFTRDETLQAARRVVSAAQLTAQSAFLFPARVFDGYGAGDGQTGWDVGPDLSARYGEFLGIEEQDRSISGAALQFFSSSEANTLLADGADGFDTIALPASTGENLRLYAIARETRLDGAAYPLPFGYSVQDENKSYRVVDARRAAGTPWVSLADSAITLHGARWTAPTNEGAEGEVPALAKVALSVRGYDDMTLAEARSTPGNDAAAILSVPVEGGLSGIALAISQLDSQTTTVSGFVLGVDPMPAVLSALAARVRDFERSSTLVAGRSGQSADRAAKPSEPKVARRPLGYLPVQMVDYPEALAGSLAGTQAGTRAMQAYLDGAGGDLGRLEDRAMALIDGLEARKEAEDFLTLADAANRITEATAQAAATTYLMNGFVGMDFDLPEPEAGWDFGYDDELPYSGFTRAGDSSPVIIGDSTTAGDIPGQTPMVHDFLTRVEGLRFSLPSTYYRVMMLVAPSARTGTASPLGNSLLANGAPTRLRDLRELDPGTWGRLAGGSIGMHGGLDAYGPVDPRLEAMLNVPDDLAPLRALMMNGGVFTDLPPTGQDQDSAELLPSGQRNAFVYAARAYVGENRALIFDFSAPPEGGTVIGAAIVGESDPEPLAERLAERIADLLGSNAPAAGFLPGDIFPSAGNVFAAAFSAPIQVASAQSSQGGRAGPGASAGPVGGGGGLGGQAVDPGTDTGGTDTGGTDTGGTDTGGTDTGGTDTGGTDTGGTDTGGTDTGGTDTGGTDTGGTDTGGTDTGGTDTGGTDTGGTDTGGTDTGGTDTGGTDTGGTDTGGTDTGGTDTGGTDTGGTDTGGTDTGGTDTGGTDTGGTDTGGTDTGGTDTGGTDTGGTDTGGTDTGGTDTGGTDTGGTDTGGTDTGGTDTGGTDTGGTDTGGTDTGGTDTGGTDTGGTDTGGTDTGGTDTGGTDTGGTDTGGTDTGGTDTGGTDTGGTDTGGTDTGGTDTGGTDTGGTDTGGTDTGGTDTGGTDTGGTDTGGTDTGGTDTGGTDTGGTDTGGTDTGGTDTGGTDTGGTDTGGTDTGGTDTGGTDTGGTDTGGTDTGGTDTGGTDTGGTDTGGTDTGGTDTGGTDTGGTDTGGTDTGGTDTGGTDTGGTDTGGTDTGGTDTGGTDTGGTDTGGTDTGGTDTGGTDTGGTDTGGTDTGGTDTGGTDTGGTDTGGTDTGGTDTGGTDTGGTDTGGTDTGGTDTGGTDTGGTDTGGTDTGGTDTGGTDTGGTDTGGTDTGGTDTGGTDTGGTDTGGTDTGGTDTGGTDTGGTDTGGTDTGGTDTGGTDTGGTDTGGTDTGGDVILLPDAGGPYRVLVEEEFTLDGSDSIFNIGLDEFDIEWLLIDAGMPVFLATGLGTDDSPLDPSVVSFDDPGRYDILLEFTFGDLVVSAPGLIIVVAGQAISVPGSILLFLPGLALLARLRRRR